jgi:hypothetical protein
VLAWILATALAFSEPLASPSAASSTTPSPEPTGFAASYRVNLPAPKYRCAQLIKSAKFTGKVRLADVYGKIYAQALILEGSGKRPVTLWLMIEAFSDYMSCFVKDQPSVQR